MLIHGLSTMLGTTPCAVIFRNVRVCAAFRIRLVSVSVSLEFERVCELFEVYFLVYCGTIAYFLPNCTVAR